VTRKSGDRIACVTDVGLDGDSRFVVPRVPKTLRIGGESEQIMMRCSAVMGALVLFFAGTTGCTGDDTAGAGPSDAGQTADSTSTTDASPPADSGADASTSDASDGSLDAPSDASDAGTAYALFVGTDFTSAELSVVGLRPDSVAGRLAISDQDSVPYASGGLGFVLEHTLGQTIVLDRTQPWMTTTTIDINDSPDAGSYASNPRTVLVTTGAKAYVARYASNLVKIVDVAAGTVTGSVDLSSFVAPDDPDGLVDVQDGAYDPSTQRAYFLLQRINQFDFSGSAPDYVSACLTSHAEIVAVDATTDAIVDLNGSAAGQAIDLLGDNPAQIVPELATGALVIADSGCYGVVDGGADGGQVPREGRGVESVALATGTPTWLYQTTDVDRLSGVVWVDATHAFVNQGSDWFSWNPTQTTLGASVADFPQAPLYDGTSRILGLSAAEPDAGSDGGVTWSVVAMDVTSLQVTQIAQSPFQSVVPATSYGVTSALIP
jgi:hypothetical protein